MTGVLECVPASLDAERCVLGAILLDNAAFDEAAEYLSAQDFSLDAHRRIFSRMSDMIRGGSVADTVTLATLLADRKEVQAIGGIAYLASLTDGLPRKISIAEYVRLVREKSMLRQIIVEAEQLITRAADQTEAAELLISDADHKLLAISADKTEWPSIEKQSYAEIERLGRQRTGEQPSYYEYGIPLLDHLLGGLVRKEMTVLGGRPGQGKSSLVAQIAVLHVRRGVPVHVFTLEMSAGKFLRRIWAYVSGIPFHKLRHPERLSSDEYQRVHKAMLEVSTWPLILDDAATVSIDQLISRARISRRRHKTEIIAIDYLQKLRFGEKAVHRYLEVTDAAVKLSRLAKEEDIAVLLLSSLTEKGEKNRNEAPTIADFRQSGDIAFEASTALLLHREVDSETEKLKPTGELIVGKARDDSQGVVPIAFNTDFLIFEEAQSYAAY